MINMFPQRLKALRKERKISQQKLGKHLNFGYTAIANYESGRNQPSIDTLIHLAEYLDVTVDYLIGASDYPTKEKELLKEEKELLDDFRNLNDRDKVIVHEVLKIMLKQ